MIISFIYSFIIFILHIVVSLFLVHWIGLLFSYFFLNSILMFFVNYFCYVLIFFGIFLSFILKNPVYILLSILCSFINTALLFIGFGIEILSFIFLIVYIGALMMLFLFIIMLFNLQIDIQNLKNTKFFVFFVFFIFIFFFEHLLICIEMHSLFPLKNLINIEFSTLFFFSSYTLNSNLLWYTLFCKNNEDFYIFIILFILLFALITSIHAAMLTKYLWK